MTTDPTTTDRPARRLFVCWEQGPILAAAALIRAGRDGSFTRDEAEAEHWNGWACPVFFKAEIDEVIRWQRECVEDGTMEDGVETISWQGDDLHLAYDGESFHLKPTGEIDGQPVWELNGWTWDVIPSVDIVVNVVQREGDGEVPMPRLDDAEHGVTTSVHLPDTGATYLVADLPDPDMIGWDRTWEEIASHVLGSALTKALGEPVEGWTTETVCERHGWMVDSYDIAEHHDPYLPE